MTEEPRQELDILEMPLEGVAAFWLSLKKIMGAKIAPKTLQDEADNTTEPYIRFMIELCLSGLDDVAVRRAGLARRDTALRDLELKTTLMRDALLSMAAGENPRMGLLRMCSRLALPSISEEHVTKMALDMVRMAEKSRDGYVVTIGPRLPAEELMVKLMFYVLWARREGKAAIEPFGENGRFRHFNQALAMTADGHDRGFIKACMDSGRAGILADAAAKMDLSLEMTLALRGKVSYDDMFRIAQGYLP